MLWIFVNRDLRRQTLGRSKINFEVKIAWNECHDNTFWTLLWQTIPIYKWPEKHIANIAKCMTDPRVGCFCQGHCVNNFLEFQQQANSKVQAVTKQFQPVVTQSKCCCKAFSSHLAQNLAQTLSKPTSHIFFCRSHSNQVSKASVGLDWIGLTGGYWCRHYSKDCSQAQTFPF